MSESTYIRGFCKAAEAQNIDPRALARYTLDKVAQDSGGDIWEAVKDYIGQAKGWYDKQNELTHGLLGAGLGSAVGTGVGAALFGKRGLRSGAVLGALAGGAGAVDWKKVYQQLDDMKRKAEIRRVARKTRQQAPALAAASKPAADLEKKRSDASDLHRAMVQGAAKENQDKMIQEGQQIANEAIAKDNQQMEDDLARRIADATRNRYS